MRRAPPALAAAWTLGLAAPALSQPAAGDPGGASAAAGAAAAPSALYRVEPRRVEQAPRIDGRLDEAAWRAAAVINEFVQQEPAEGAPATERTTVRLLYDARALYVGVEAFDSQPAGVIATEMRRDSPRLLDEDNFQMILDTFDDDRSGYMFVVSPLGAKLEQQIAEEGEGGFRGSNSPNVNVNWDGVWNAAARRTAEGWVAEIAIPMVTLRFPAADPQVWGANFMRNIRRKNEQVFWAPVSKEYSLTRVSRAGAMTGIRAINRGLDLRLTPYVLAGGRQDRVDGRLDGSGLNEYGIDVKYGVASGLNLDLTLNTDFAQVEVDEQQVNLTRFPLFFPEKRDFFLENAGMFNVGGGGGFGRTADLFFTRRIGLSESGAPIPIIGGARLTGKTGRHNVAVMNITTRAAPGAPGDNFFVGRYSRDVLARSKVGALVIDKRTVGGGRRNRTLAADATLALHPNFTMTGFLAKTDTPPEAFPDRYEPLAPDAEARDAAGYARATWLSPSWHVYAEFVDLQEHFNPEVGFVPRVGIRTSSLHGEWNPRPGRWSVRMLDPMWNVTYTTDQRNRLLTRRIHNMIGVYFEDGSSAIVWYNDHFEQLDLPFRIRPDVTIPAGTYRFGEWTLLYRSDPSRRLYARAQYAPQTFFDGTRTDVRLTLGLRATSRVAAEAVFNRSDVALPGGAFVADLASLRLDVTLSPRMTFRSLSQYNSTTRELGASLRFNWIYRPGSDVYVAYDDVRLDGDPLMRDPHLRRPRWVRSRQLAIKMTYLLSR